MIALVAESTESGPEAQRDVTSPGDLVDDGTAEDADAVDEVVYTIDELAALSGVPSRTIRFYQSKGLVTAPERRGRVAFYGAEHLDRLRTIADLQDRGLRLDAIRDALKQLAEGDDSLQDWLGMGDLLQRPWSDDKPSVVTEADLLELLGNPRRGVLDDLERLRLIERQTDSRPASYVVRSPALLEIGAELTKHGIDPVTVAEVEVTMRKRMAKLTDELVTFFADRAGEGFGGGGEPDEILESYEALRPMGLRAIQLVFAQEMERSLRGFVEAGGAMPRPGAGRPAPSSKQSRSRRTRR